MGRVEVLLWLPRELYSDKTRMDALPHNDMMLWPYVKRDDHGRHESKGLF